MSRAYDQEYAKKMKKATENTDLKIQGIIEQHLVYSSKNSIR